MEFVYRLLRADTIKKRLRFWFIFLMLLLVLLSSFPIILIEKGFREEEAQNNINQIINLQQVVIEKWFDERKTDIQTISTLPVVKSLEKERMKEAFMTFDAKKTEFTGIVYVNKDGVSEIDTSGPTGIDLSDRIYFREALKGKSYETDMLIGRQSNQAIIIFSSPVFDYQNQFKGLIFGSVGLDTINQIMRNVRFSETVQTYLVNREGLLITEPRFSNLLNSSGAAGKKIATEVLHQALDGQTMNHSYLNDRGEKVFGEYRWVNDHKWLIIGEIAQDDVFAPFYRMILTFSVALIIVLLVGFGLAIWISNRVEKPINQVLEGAREMGRAKYDYRIEWSVYAQHSIEMQELCKTFNQMAEMIQFQMRSLKKSEERYRSLVEYSPNAIIVHQDGKIVYANPSSIGLLKASSKEDLLGRKLLDLVSPEYKEFVEKRMKQLQSKNPVGLIEEKYVRFDNTVIDVEVIAAPIEYMDKPASQIIIQDISQRKAMERELQKAQEQYRSVVEHVKEVIFQTDEHGLWTFLNPAWEEITGYTIEESMGNHFLNYVHPDDRDRNSELFRPLIEREKDYCRHEIRYLKKSGDFCWVEVFARLTLDDQGQILGTSGTSHDITKRKESEEQLKESEERFRMLAEYSRDMITLHDTNGKYLYVSPACQEILQYEGDELVGHDVFWHIHPDDVAMMKNHQNNLLKTGYTVSTFRIRRKDGEYVWIESSIKLLHRSDVNVPQVIAVSRNIHERKLAEHRLQEANEILQRLSSIDGLTGIPNRRMFDDRLELEWNRSLENSTPLSLIMLDIDFFKAYNDTYGHLGGDSCLKQVALTIQNTLERSTDLVCRYGGEEFAVILPEISEEGTKRIAEKIRSAVERLEIPHKGSKISKWITISLGTATMNPTCFTSTMDLITSADKALYKAKKDGRNRVQQFGA